MQVIVKEVSNKKEFKAFYQYQNKLYAGCKAYVPTLDIDQKSSLSKDPALDYCKRKLWLAYKGDKVVGRVQGIINPRYNDFHNSSRIRFGWFDFEEDLEIARALLDTVMEWGRKEGMTQVHGPLAYNTLGRQGMLIEGFDNVPSANCLYNHPYYGKYMEQLGFAPEVDWIQYKLNASQGAPDKLNRLSDILIKRYNLKVLDIRELKGERKERMIKRFFAAYNDCFQVVPNFIPLTDKEVSIAGASYFKALVPDLTCLVVDAEDNIAAFGLGLPSLSAALQKAKGKLFPFGWYHLLKAYRSYTDIDLLLIGSGPQFAHKGLSAIYHAHLAKNFQKHHLKNCYTNPQVVTLTDAIKVWESYEHEDYMRRRCWIKDL